MTEPSSSADANLVSEWGLDELDQDEVLDPITRYCRGGGGRDGNWKLGGGINEYHLHFKGDRLEALFPGPNTNQSALKDRIDKDLCESVGTRYATRILFTYAATVVNGWRHRNRFQILPAPADLPRPEVLMGDFPFLLQFAYEASTSSSANSIRREKMLHRLERLLAILIPKRVSRPGEGRHGWAILREPGPSLRYRSEWLQPGYEIGWDPPSDDAFIPVDSIEPTDALSPQHLVMLPPYADELAGRYFGLGPEEQQTFDRAAQYFYLAQKSDESVLTWVALVGAIESLTPGSAEERCSDCDRPKPTGEICEVCGQGDGATKQFRDLLGSLVPDPTTNERQARNRIYATRSGFAHGASRLDPRVGFGVQSAAQMRLRADSEYGFSLVRQALQTWLLR